MVIEATPSSIVTGIQWPAIPEPRVSSVLTLLWQLEQSQWWTSNRLAAAQQRQLGLVLRHAATTVQHYQERLAEVGAVPASATFDADVWGKVPILTRSEITASATRLTSRGYPAAHGDTLEVLTSRTSGEPVRVRSTGVTQMLWQAITLRDHAWHRRDLDLHLAAIRHVPQGSEAPEGTRSPGWGPATASLAPKAPMSLLSIAATTEQQLDWLRGENPDYLLIYPSALEALLSRLAATGQRLPKLREVRTIGEALGADIRQRVREILGVPLVDTYSAQEVGYIALQCPDEPAHYHVQAERLLVEILRDDGTPCVPGETGRVVITDLHNFATPIVRYEIGDYAEVGEACPCGRGLPTLRRILGRRRGMLRYPDGRTTWPLFAVACRRAARYREIQLIQERVDALRLRVVAEDPLSSVDRTALTAALHGTLRHPFTIEIEQVAELSRSPGGKLEEFVSRIES